MNPFKRVIVLLFWLVVTGALQAQKVDTLTVAKQNSKTAEDVLNLPADKYTVVKCDIRVTFKGENTTFYYAPGFSRPFDKIWQQIMKMVHAGDKITFDHITIKKDSKENPLMPKTFIVP